MIFYQTFCSEANKSRCRCVYGVYAAAALVQDEETGDFFRNIIKSFHQAEMVVFTSLIMS